MTLNAAEVEQALLALDPGEREEVIRRVIARVDGDGEDQYVVDQAWLRELEIRIDDIKHGRVELLDLEESHAQIRAELAARFS